MKGAFPKGCPVMVGFLMAAKISGASGSERITGYWEERANPQRDRKLR
jgi:hypothetical protein